MMRTYQCHPHVTQRGGTSNLHILNSSAMSPLSTASLTLAVLLVLAIPVCKRTIIRMPMRGQAWHPVVIFLLIFMCISLFLYETKGAPAQLQEATIDQNQLLNQVNNTCSSHLSFFLSFLCLPPFLVTSTHDSFCVPQIDDVCSSYLSADLPFWASDVLGELCVLMLVQKSKELKVRENSKRSNVLHPLLQLIPQLHTRRERGVSVRDDLQGPGGIQSRGYFLYRPRNGRRSLEYE
ncbi:neuromedin-U [Polymixia lowei]